MEIPLPLHAPLVNLCSPGDKRGSGTTALSPEFGFRVGFCRALEEMFYPEIRAARVARPLGFLPATSWTLTSCAMPLPTPSPQHPASGLSETSVPPPPLMSAPQPTILIPSCLWLML